MIKAERLESGSYRVKVHLGGGKYKSITRPTKKEAQIAAAQFEAELAENKIKSEDPHCGMTVSQAIDTYISTLSNVASPKTIREYKQMRNNNYKSIENIKISDITSQQIQAAVNDFAINHSPKTTRNAYSLLRSSIISQRPDFSPKIKLPQKERPQIVIPTEREVIALLDYAKDSDLELPLMLAALCGMRMSEIIGLQWKSVDIETDTIRIENAIVLDENNRQVLKKPKSDAGYRTIKLLPQVSAALIRNKNDRDFVVDLTANSIKKRYNKALEATGCEHYTFHELRHYAASVMIMLGIPVKYIADYLGHETENMVNRVYGHIMADKKDEMFARLETYYKSVFEKSATKSAMK
ncbi:MAG: site-specific integrase [Clostridiales bacterium]|nr:site-specific integrase [Clostridiales bacterium]